MDQSLKKLPELTFDNRFVDQLPGDPDPTNARRQVSGAAYSRVLPTPVIKPQTIGFAREVSELIGLDPSESTTDEFAKVFGGNELLAGMDPFAMCYGGHQFGHWAGQLGDGRAINLGEVKTDAANSAAARHWTLQLKGAGPTPYSRTADGLAVLRSSVREFLCSEAMFHLGVPTTRALSLVKTGEQVMRDMFYDGRARYEPGAVVCRVAPSFVRFGNFQIFASRGDQENLQRLVDFTINSDFPELGTPTPKTYGDWFHEVCIRTCDMVVHWMRVGFVHGVMNTDNMSILGLTIDYGPYGWLEGYDPGWTPNTTDAEGKRYRFGNQPLVAHWNLYQLGNAILPLVEDPADLQRGLDAYLSRMEYASNRMIADKLGLEEFRPSEREPDQESPSAEPPSESNTPRLADDEALKQELFEVLTLVETDMTIFYRKLASVTALQDDSPDSDLSEQAAADLISPLQDAYYAYEEVTGPVQLRIANWLRRYRNRLSEQDVSDQERCRRMNLVNPKYVLRNYIAQLAIDQAEAGDYELIGRLLEVFRHPYDEQPEHEEFAGKRPEWARHRAGCSMLSCSS